MRNKKNQVFHSFFFFRLISGVVERPNCAIALVAQQVIESLDILYSSQYYCSSNISSQYCCFFDVPIGVDSIRHFA